LRAWVEENRQALELIQQGAEQSEATEYLAGDPLTFGTTMSPRAPNSWMARGLKGGLGKEVADDTLFSRSPTAGPRYDPAR
jgi:hypothetical protein